MKLIAVVAFLLVINVVNSQYYESCVNPTGVTGFCQPIRSCDSLLNILMQYRGRQIPYDVRIFLRRSQCKYYFEPWVCCPSVTEQTTAAPVTTVRSTVPSTASRLPEAPECGVDADNRIYGGEETTIDEYPWLAQLQYNKPRGRTGFHCGGSLINQKYVVTAAHCIGKVPSDWDLVSVRLGEWDTTTVEDCDDSFFNERVCNDPHVDVPVEKKIIHESYVANSKNQHHDIALLRLSRTVTYTDFIKPICLQVNSDVRNLNLDGKSLDVAGWGKTETSYTSDRKLKVAVAAYPNSKCQEVYSRSGLTILDSQICAGGAPGKDSCNGDSGGPLMEHYESGPIPYYFLAGIVSYGPKNCGTEDVPGVYTRVSKYVDWIQSKLEN
ncbi:CLUMA_CG003753, isoform A [Clunio marinus]|uniref:CLIP domain-containing serine protease n=1 Tax=Clunio marinus TaxID=568069 RepID=A0A1J1HRL0_9DIPT|nr:CLUMA_CG000779, isoform A [Clunio marinus]CRK90028.1 CLUMA_CG003753, isoform A [Clunio marinus]